MKNKHIKFIFKSVLFAAVWFYAMFVNADICKALAGRIKSGNIEPGKLKIPKHISGQSSVIHALEDGIIKIGTGDIVATCNFGYTGECKYSRFVRADILAGSRKRDFNGMFRVEYLDNSQEDSIMVQKRVSIKAGGEELIQFALPYMERENIIRVSLYDENNEMLCYKLFSLDYNINSSMSQVYAGILSDNSNEYMYIKRLVSQSKASQYNNRNIVCMLDENSITNDARMLDSLDVIIIDGYNSQSLSQAQAEALRQWTRDGGALFIGGGSGADKVFKALNSWLTVKTGKKLKINTDFGIKGGKKVLTDITQTELKGSVPVLTDCGEELVSKIKYGIGNVFVVEFPLEFTEEYSGITGPVIADIVVKSISSQKKKEKGVPVCINGTDNSAVYMKKTVALNETGVLPNIKLYAVIMLVYVFLAGPGVYFLVKKKDKRSLLWIIIPSLSLAFAALVYLTGTSTRIQKPYINFVSTLDLSARAEKENPVNTIFSVTSPDNSPYEIEFPVNTGIMPLNINGQISSMPDTDNITAGYGIEYGNNTLKAVINGLPAFSSAYFQLENKRTSSGTVEVKVSEDDGKLLGTISNNMSCMLENCILYHNGRVHYIKSLLPGETFDITAIKDTDIYEIKDYNNDFENLIEDITGGSMEGYDTNNIIKRKIGMIMAFASSNKPGSTWFYGFDGNGGETGFANLSGYKSYGETGIYKRINIA